MSAADRAALCVRPAAESDLPAIRAVLAACAGELPPLSSENDARLFLPNIRRGSALLALTGDEPVGVVIWSPVLRRISLLAVRPERRRSGVGSRLLEAALERMPPGDVCVETYRAGDPRGAAAHALYRRFGFREDAPIDGYEIPMQRYRLCRE